MVFATVFLVSLAGCNLPQRGPAVAPTQNVTQAYQTVAARLTEAVLLTPSPAQTRSPVPTDSGIPTPTVTPAPASVTPAQEVRPPTATATTACDRVAPGLPIDVTIPDDTQMRPGQSFTKTWRLQNVGSCTWNGNYAVELFSGDAMGAATRVPLPRSVSPGQSVDVSVDMVAPQTAGTFQGNWKLRNAGNQWFGIGPAGDAPFWVRVVVVPTATVTVTPGGATPTPTVTPAVQSTGTVVMAPGDRLDLDRSELNPASGDDLVYETVSDSEHRLAPQGNVVMVLIGNSAPSFSTCQAAAMNANPVPVERLAVGTYLCYRTGQGLPGRAQVSSFNPANSLVTLELLTWSLP